MIHPRLYDFYTKWPFYFADAGVYADDSLCVTPHSPAFVAAHPRGNNAVLFLFELMCFEGANSVWM